ncbi:MAG TPA: PPOX class F420-dependent oxidoreductase [Chloroflexota bacterium]
MDADEARAFITTHHHAVLATRRRDGSIQMSPVAVGADDDGRLIISTTEPSAKVKNLRRDPAASLCVISDGFYGPWVQIDGTVTIESLPDALEGLVRYYRKVAGEHPDWEDYRIAMQREQRVLVHLTIERVAPKST